MGRLKLEQYGDPNLTTPYEFYQYWRNVEDSSVERLLGLLTFLPMSEVRKLGALEGVRSITPKKYWLSN